MIGMDHILCGMHIEMGEWKLHYMSPTKKVAEEFAIFGSDLEPMVSLSTIENYGENGKWSTT